MTTSRVFKDDAIGTQPVVKKNGLHVVPTMDVPKKKPYSRYKLIINSLFAVTALSSIGYFGYLKTPQYVSNVDVSVSNPQKDSDSLTSLLSGSSGASTSGAYIVKEFLLSWDEFKRLNARFNLRDEYSGSDWATRYGSLMSVFDKGDISLWHYYQKHVDVSVDQKTGITTIGFYGLSPDFAHKLAVAAMGDTVKYLDDMNRQQESDYTSSAEKTVNNLKLSIIEDGQRLATYRIANGVYDPSLYYSGMLARMTSLQGKQIDADAQYRSVAVATPNNPVALSYKTQMGVLGDNIKKITEDVFKVTALSNEYEDLKIRQELDTKLLAEAEAGLETSRIKASQNHYYINVISEPSKPVDYEYPSRLVMIAITILVLGGLWLVFR